MSEEPQSPEETPEAADGPAGEVDVQAALEAEVAALKEQVLRYAADAENVRRRAERETNDARAYAIQRFAKDLLSVADTLERGLATAPKDADGPAAAMVTGLELTQKSLLSAFEANGLTRVDPAPGDAFDPHLHQAMMEQESPDLSPGAVIQCLQPGYELLGRLVRPAMVVVASRGSGGAAPSGEGPGARLDTRA